MKVEVDVSNSPYSLCGRKATVNMNYSAVAPGTDYRAQDNDDDDDHSYMGLFSALEPTHCVFVCINIEQSPHYSATRYVTQTAGHKMYKY